MKKFAELKHNFIQKINSLIVSSDRNHLLVLSTCRNFNPQYWGGEAKVNKALYKFNKEVPILS